MVEKTYSAMQSVTWSETKCVKDNFVSSDKSYWTSSHGYLSIDVRVASYLCLRGLELKVDLAWM